MIKIKEIIKEYLDEWTECKGSCECMIRKNYYKLGICDKCQKLES